LPTDSRVFPFGRLFLTCWLIYAVHWAPFMVREEFPAITLATSATLNVERFVGWTGDIFRVPDGRAFINNNPGASIVGAVPLILARPALDRLERWNDTDPESRERAQHASDFPASPAVQARREWYFMAVGFLTAAGVMASVSALAATALGWTLWSSGVTRSAAIAASLAYGFPTPILVRTSYLNHNLLVCQAGLLAALLLWDQNRRPVAVSRAAAAGALAGFAVLCDYSGVLVLGAIGLYAWLRAGDARDIRLRFTVAAAYGAGAAPMLIALAAYQHWAFGYSALPSQTFMPAIEQTARGYRGMDWPSLDLMWMNFFDRRFGLFVVCPLLSLALVAPMVRRGRFRLPGREMWLALLFFGGLTLFCAANQYSRLQWNTGIRYLVPAVPGLLLLSLQVLQLAPVTIQLLVLAASFLMAWSPAATGILLSDQPASLGELQLSWLHRMAAYGAIAHPGRATAILLAATAGAVVFIWRREIGHAPTTVAPGAAKSRRQ